MGDTAKFSSRKLIVAATTAVILALAGCGGEDPASNAGVASTGQRSSNLKPLKLEKTEVTFTWAKFAANNVMRIVPQFAEKYGLKVNLLLVRTGSDGETALLNGNADFAGNGYSYLFQALDNGAHPVVVVNGPEGGTGIALSNKLNVASDDWARLLSLAESRARSGNKLLLVTNTASMNYALASLSMKQHGIDPASLFTIQNVLNFNEQPQMLAQGAADIIITGQPQVATVTVQRIGKFFAAPYDTPAGKNLTQIQTTADFAAAYPNTVQAFVNAYADASEYLTAHPDQNLQDVLSFTGLSEDIALEAMNDVFYGPALNVSSCELFAASLYKSGVTKNDYTSQCPSLLKTQFVSQWEQDWKDR